MRSGTDKAKSKPKAIPLDYSERVRLVRARLGLTQSRLAEVLGVSVISVNRWENGQAKPGPLAWQQLLRTEEEHHHSGPGETGVSALTPAAESAGICVAQTDEESVPDFSGSSEAVSAVVEAERLSFGHQANPAFAAELSLIDPLPHQRIAVYDLMLRQPRLRLLLADDAGAGKTIMAGLYIREMLSRRLIRRVLVVAPAGLVGNWERELRRLFNLHFRILSSQDARQGNPFTGEESDLVIVSLDTLAGEKMFGRLREEEVAPYDLVIFDEAHKLSANRNADLTVRKTDRYKLAEALAGASLEDQWSLPWQPTHLLLLTATPHMGNDYPYFALWRLLEPDVLATEEALHAYPADARRRHFLRRVKEEMVRFDGQPLYPRRESKTWTFDLSEGEEKLYEATTHYIRTYYNRARILNRAAARLAMSVFQRRLASSSYALLRSFERRLSKLDGLIADIRENRLTADQLAAQQRRLDDTKDVFDAETADEETSDNGREENEDAEDKILGGVIATTLAELGNEREEVTLLRQMAANLYDSGEESKFNRMLEAFRDGQFRNEKVLVFTEHRDTMDYIVRRLKGLGYEDRVAHIHGGMDFREREQQVDFFRRDGDDGGAQYMICTDAAGEGLNMQFCWLMINYDIPWNPARIEQRFGRIHRYGQKHDPVLLFNLVAVKTREGRVLDRLLSKLDDIRRALHSDKVFDVIGAQFAGISLRDLMLRVAVDGQTDAAMREIDQRLTPEATNKKIQERERVYGHEGDVAACLPDQRAQLERENLRRLLPGYVRRFIERAAPLLHIGVRGDMDTFFSLEPQRAGALDFLWSQLETYPPEVRQHLAVFKPKDGAQAVFLHPGERIFDRFSMLVSARLGSAALKGAVFVDPTAEAPYLVHVASIRIVHRPEPLQGREHAVGDTLECRLVALKQTLNGEFSMLPVEHLLLLKGAPAGAFYPLAATVRPRQLCEQARVYLSESVLAPEVEARRQALHETLPGRIEFLTRGFAYRNAELAAMRGRWAEKARVGDTRIKQQFERVKQRQRDLVFERDRAVETLRREPESISTDIPRFLAHALVIPTTDPEDRMRHDYEVERIAVRVARAREELVGRQVRDVSTPAAAVAAGLEEWPGFDLLSRGKQAGDQYAIEVKGRAAIGAVEVSDNEWAKACNLRGSYWLYVVFNCASDRPELHRVQDPFGKLIGRSRGGVIIDATEILQSSESEVITSRLS